ncbi:hypothetical protein K501DRAFT_31419 [Backusella circina FSU 941]|nr:hypothetical protein K501DRAFT_31419 [Backusella circina FSU 941]
MTKEKKSLQRVQTDSRNNKNVMEGYSHHNPQYYEPTPAPTTVVVHSVPNKTNGACCWGW